MMGKKRLEFLAALALTLPAAAAGAATAPAAPPQTAIAKIAVSGAAADKLQAIAAARTFDSSVGFVQEIFSRQFSRIVINHEADDAPVASLAAVLGELKA